MRSGKEVPGAVGKAISTEKENTTQLEVDPDTVGATKENPLNISTKDGENNEVDSNKSYIKRESKYLLPHLRDLVNIPFPGWLKKVLEKAQYDQLYEIFKKLQKHSSH